VKIDRVYLRKEILSLLLERHPTGDEFFNWHRTLWIEFMRLHPNELIMTGSHEEEFDNWLKDQHWDQIDIDHMIKHGEITPPRREK